MLFVIRISILSVVNWPVDLHIIWGGRGTISTAAHWSLRVVVHTERILVTIISLFVVIMSTVPRWPRRSRPMMGCVAIWKILDFGNSHFIARWSSRPHPIGCMISIEIAGIRAI